MPEDKRTIVISDIHGNLKLFKRLLEQVNYTKDDVLILLGDLVEKGDESLETLRYIMKLSKENTVHALMGNCDAIWEDVLYEVNDQALLRYMLFRPKSIVNEMCKQLSITVDENSDIKFIKRQLLDSFSKELNWLSELPHIIETKDYIFAHAGIENEILEENEAFSVMKNDAFIKKGLAFSKYVVLGHWPSTNYCKERGCHLPIINSEQRIISIDGGNAIKRDGQLNALIIRNNDIASIEFATVDNLPKGLIIEANSESEDSININWDDNGVELLEEKGEYSFCRHITTNHKFWIKSTQLFTDKTGLRCYDYTDYILPVSKGDIVSIAELGDTQAFVKKDSVVGWVPIEKLQEID